MDNVAITKLLKVGYKAKADGVTIEDLGPEQFAELLGFINRDSYLEWAADWKATYREHSDLIRTKRAECKELQKAGSPDASTMQAFLASKSHTARLLISLRRASKKRSWELKKARIQIDEGVFV